MDYATQVGVRYLRSKKRRFISVITAFAIAGVAIAVWALSIVISVTSGFEEAFRDKVLGVNAHVLILKYGLDFTEYREVMQKVRRVRGVVGVAPFVINEMMVVRGPRQSGVLLKGIDPERMPEVLDLPRHLIAGSLEGLRLPGARPPLGPREGRGRSREETDAEFDRALEQIGRTRAEAAGPAGVEPAAPPGIVIGKTLAHDLALHVGDTVRIISPLNGLDSSFFRATPATPRSREFRVVGIFDAGFDEYDSRLVYIDLYEAQAFYDYGDAVTGVEIKVADVTRAPQVARRLERMLASEGPFHTVDWQELNKNLFTALFIQKIGFSSVLTVFIVVASFVIIGTLIMVVLDKRREIAILKAMGATNGGVMRVFLIQGVLIGLVGTVAGLVLGYGSCLALRAFGYRLEPGVYLIDRLPVRIAPMDFLVVGVVAMLICTVATLIPSWRAARMLPVDGLRYE